MCRFFFLIIYVYVNPIWSAAMKCQLPGSILQLVVGNLDPPPNEARNLPDYSGLEEVELCKFVLNVMIGRCYSFQTFIPVKQTAASSYINAVGRAVEIQGPVLRRAIKFKLGFLFLLFNNIFLEKFLYSL